MKIVVSSWICNARLGKALDTAAETGCLSDRNALQIPINR